MNPDANCPSPTRYVPFSTSSTREKYALEPMFQSPCKAHHLLWSDCVVRGSHSFVGTMAKGISSHENSAQTLHRMLFTTVCELIEVAVQVLASVSRKVDQRNKPAIRQVVERNCRESGCKARKAKHIAMEPRAQLMLSASCRELGPLLRKYKQLHESVQPALSGSAVLLKCQSRGEPNSSNRQQRLRPSRPYFGFQAGCAEHPWAIERVGHVGFHSRAEAKA